MINHPKSNSDFPVQCKIAKVISITFILSPQNSGRLLSRLIYTYIYTYTHIYIYMFQLGTRTEMGNAACRNSEKNTSFHDEFFLRMKQENPTIWSWLVSLNKASLNPYFWEGYIGWGGRWTSHDLDRWFFLGWQWVISIPMFDYQVYLSPMGSESWGWPLKGRPP